MLLIVAVVVGGILIGLALGGSMRNLAEARLRLWPLAVAGLVLQIVPIPSRPGQVDHWVAVGLLLASYGMLLVFVAANIRVPGFPLIAIGFALNALVIGVNGGMPVKDQALRQAAGSRYDQSRQRLVERGGLRHHLARPDDVLLPLSDAVGIGGPIRTVYSPGDLLSYVGAAWAIAALTRRARKPGRGVPETAVRPEPGDDLGGPPPDPAAPVRGSDPMASTPRPDPLASDPASPPP